MGVRTDESRAESSLGVPVDLPRVNVPAGPVPPSGSIEGLGPKALRTRAKLIEAATEVFAERQYLDTNVEQIVERAGVSHGTFYTYFLSKSDVFREVGLSLLHRLLETARATEVADDASLYERVEATNRSYLHFYRENAALFAVIEQGATYNDELRAIRREMRNGYVHRSEHAIAGYQRDGLVAADIDPRLAAYALGAMVERFAYVWLVLGEEFDFEQSVRALTTFWARALGIEEPVAED